MYQIRIISCSYHMHGIDLDYDDIDDSTVLSKYRHDAYNNIIAILYIDFNSLHTHA